MPSETKSSKSRTRKGPSEHANDHPWTLKRGSSSSYYYEDDLWLSKPDKNNVFHWTRVTEKNIIHIPLQSKYDVKNIGDWEAESKVLIGDLSYDRPPKESNTPKKKKGFFSADLMDTKTGLKTGTWKVFVFINEQGNVARWITHAKGYKVSACSKKWSLAGGLGVDGGNIGVYNWSTLPDDAMIDPEFAEQLINGGSYFIFNNKQGFDTTSGWGDGSYPYYIMKKGKKIIGIQALFIPDIQLEEEKPSKVPEHIPKRCIKKKKER